MGHKVLVVTASDRGDPYTEEEDGVQLERVSSLSNPFWREGPIPWVSPDTLRDMIDRFRPDLIHTHENAILSFQLLRLGRISGISLISSCYYLPRYITQYLNWGAPLENVIETTLWKYAISNLNQYDHVIFSTQTQRQEFIEHGLSAPSLAISNGVDNARYYPTDRDNGRSAAQSRQVEDVESRYNLPPRPRILFVGRLMRDKKIDLLIRAMKLVCENRNAHLLVVGRGDERESLEALARDLGLEQNIHLLGYVPESDLPALYRCSDLFAIASVVEVQSIPALQAAATGLPIVAANAAALPELVQTGVNGFLVQPDDPQAIGEAVLKVISDQEKREAMGRASLAITQDHAESQTFEAYNLFYQSLIHSINYY
jgi:glycosyltransferase involved in cell wall biosynthesis